MKKLSCLLFLLFNIAAKAQTLNVSDEIMINGASGYGIIGKYNDRVLFFVIENNEVKLKAFDSKMRKLWEREIEPDKKNNADFLSSE